MQGEKKRRKKKKKFGYYLYAVVILVLTITNITLAFLLLTHVQNIQVSGNEISQKNEIIAWVREDKLTNNSIYTYWKFKSGSYQMPIYLEEVKVSLGAPWKVNVKVREKQMIGSMIDGNEYIYFDAEGLVMKRTTEYDASVPVIEGLNVDNTDQFSYLEVDNEKVFSYIVSITGEIEKRDLHPDRLVWEEDSMNLYFRDVCVKLGKSNFGKKVVELPPILSQLEGKKGTLHMEHYTSGRISFKENTEE